MKTDNFLPGWNARVSTKTIKTWLAVESDPLVRKIFRDVLRTPSNRYVRT